MIGKAQKEVVRSVIQRAGEVMTTWAIRPAPFLPNRDVTGGVPFNPTPGVVGGVTSSVVRAQSTARLRLKDTSDDMWEWRDTFDGGTYKRVRQTVGLRTCTLEVRVECLGEEEAYEILERMRFRVYNDRNLSELRAVNIAVQETLNIVDVPATVDQRALSSALMEFRLGYTYVELDPTYEGDVIESAELIADIDD